MDKTYLSHHGLVYSAYSYLYAAHAYQLLPPLVFCF